MRRKKKARLGNEAGLFRSRAVVATFAGAAVQPLAKSASGPYSSCMGQLSTPWSDVAGLSDILARAERKLKLGRVFLFGSRARGDARDDSDIDLAFEHESPDARWADFVNEVQDEATTLLEIDLVDLGRAAPELRERVFREGWILRG
jgi:uncharacterized protein